jgi:protein ImuB
MLPCQVFAGERERPFAVSDSDKVFFCNTIARGSGIKPGMKLAAAFALDSRLQTHPRDPQKEIAALRSIALTAMQFTSVVSLAPPFAVLLEIGGSLSLFGGLDALLEKIRVSEWGHDFSMSSAPTASGAWLLARAGLELHITEIEPLRAQLGNLPIGLLAAPPEVLQALKDIGMRTLRDVFALPREGLARRFGQEFLDTLDRALGNLPDARPPFAPPANYANKLELPAPVWEAEALLFAAKRLIGELAGFLSAKGAGILKLNLDLYHEDASVTCVPLTLINATRDPAHLISLLRERLFNLTLPSRVEAVALEACEIVPLRSRNLPLFSDKTQEKEHRAQLIERLRARLGMDAVVTVQAFPDHRPEFAWRVSEETGDGRRKGGGRGNSFHPSSFILHPSEVVHPSSPSTSLRTGLIPHPSVDALRPLWLLDPPRPLKEGETPWLDGPLTLLSGPERIESGWWDGGDVARDYFVACDTDGAKFWVFKDEQWFLHGIFA